MYESNGERKQGALVATVSGARALLHDEADTTLSGNFLQTGTALRSCCFRKRWGRLRSASWATLRVGATSQERSNKAEDGEAAKLL